MPHPASGDLFVDANEKEQNESILLHAAAQFCLTCHGLIVALSYVYIRDVCNKKEYARKAFRGVSERPLSRKIMSFIYLL